MLVLKIKLFFMQKVGGRMAKFFSDEIVTSIDVGTTKISVLVAHVLEQGRIELLGVGKSPSDGLRKGVVVDVARTIHSIKQAVKEAEIMAGIPIESAYVGISGSHIQSINSLGMVPIKQGQVTQIDINNALTAARAIIVPDGQQILHVLPQYFIIDGQDKICDPLQMHGVRLEVQAHIIMGGISSVQNLVKCCQAAGVKVQDIILEQLASAHAVLSEDERELGVAVLDIGGGTSDLALYQNGSIRHTMVLSVAGNHFTHDLAVGLRTTLAEAERIKKEYGTVCADPLQNDKHIEVELVHGYEKSLVPLSQVTHILHARAEELLSLVHEEIVTRKLHMFMTSGLVLTGGGALLHGIKELAADIFGVPVRVGNPRIEYDLPESLQSPIYATGYGLLLCDFKKRRHLDTLSGPLLARIFSRMKSWVSDLF
jgi:cell division protein FtsA